MRRIGVHTSIAGGLHLSLKRAHELGCTTMQIFTHNPRGWATGPISGEEAAAFKKLREALDINPVFAHASYLINIASPDPSLRTKSTRLLKTEISRADALGADYVVLHTGVARDPEGRQRAALSIAEALRGRKSGAGLLLENTSGKNGDIASAMADLAWLIEHSGGNVAGVCIDSCHAFAAGYDIKAASGLAILGMEIETHIGREAVRLIHLNDSKGEAGSHLDRHEHLGSGLIGLESLKRFIHRAPFTGIPIVLETPKKGDEDDVKNLSALRTMLANR